MFRSKALRTAGFDADRRVLRLQFRTGGLYDYFDVPAEVFEELTTSLHPWTELGEHITNSYRYQRLDR